MVVNVGLQPECGVEVGAMTRRAGRRPVPEAAPATDSALTVPKTSKPSFVVGIGSSAGGLEVLQETLSQLAPGTSAPFVVAQHLAPEHRSRPG